MYEWLYQSSAELSCATVPRDIMSRNAWVTSVDLPQAEVIMNSAFYGCGSLETVSAPRVKYIGSYAFGSCFSLGSFTSIGPVEHIGPGAFNNCIKLTHAPGASTVTYAGAGAFAYCSNSAFSNVEMPELVSVAPYMFSMCKSLKTASFAKAEHIGDACFYSCLSLSSIYAPNVTAIESQAFYFCSSLAEIDFPKLARLGSYAFASCRSLASVDMPLISELGICAFAYCAKLSSARFDAVTSISTQAFMSCYSLAYAYFGNIQFMSTEVFRNCVNLMSLYLSGSCVASISSVNVFTSTPLYNYSASTGAWGSIYVPSSLYEAYLSAPNWSLVSERITSF